MQALIFGFLAISIKRPVYKAAGNESWTEPEIGTHID